MGQPMEKSLHIPHIFAIEGKRGKYPLVENLSNPANLFFVISPCADIREVFINVGIFTEHFYICLA